MQVVPQSQFTTASVEETGLTFVENAILKARHAAKVSGLPALADDSGLEVDALQGAPGIYSARYAGPNANDAANCAKLLTALGGIPAERRQARFRCVLVHLRWDLDPAPLICQGAWEGWIAEQPQGEHGFGYDPIFRPTNLGVTAAELAPERKGVLSHRGQALRLFVESLPRQR